jgi:ABC-2 type transport system permease protein
MRWPSDLWLTYRRAMTERVRVPAWVAVSLAQPLLYLFLFGPLLKNLPSAPASSGTSAYDLFVPGLLVLMAYFVAGGAGFGLLEELTAGVIERLRVTPLSRTALVLGPAGRDMTAIAVQSVILLAIGEFTGLHVDWGGALIAVVMVCVLALALSCLSNTVALSMASANGFAALFNGLSIPVLLLSGVLLPLSLAPAWLNDLSYVNPLRYAVDAARSLVAGNIQTFDVARGLAVTAGFAVFAVALSVQHFRHAEA